MKWEELDGFTKAYIEAALWSSTDDDENPMDSNYDQFDLAPETIETMAKDCARFQEECAHLITGCARSGHGYSVDEQAGHDFWLTRNGHGAGFWDGDWPENGDLLTQASKSYGECDLYIGDDGLIYCM
ncbi:MAG: hypothetical protein KGJ13_12500 [Patescibacteria group bacterium]|nr:hypothetical protein [Patescibacteria group bacterium]